MAAWEQRRRSFRAATVVAALHGAVVWLLLSSTLPSPPAERAWPDAGPELEMVFLPPSSSATPAAHRARPERGKPAATSASPSAARPRPGPAPSPDVTPAAPVDWAAELDRAARHAAPDREAPPARDFGYPRRATPAAKAPKFGWDRAHTQRIESIPEGGLLVHLNDRCVVVLAPLPMAFCSPFKPPANSGLFDGMQEAQGELPANRAP